MCGNVWDTPLTNFIAILIRAGVATCKVSQERACWPSLAEGGVGMLLEHFLYFHPLSPHQLYVILYKLHMIAGGDKEYRGWQMNCSLDYIYAAVRNASPLWR